MQAVLACLLLVLGAHGGYAATNLGFDLLLLVRQWGPTFCQTTSCSYPAVAEFTIHGLWPEYQNGGYPQSCQPSNSFSASQLPQSLINQMNCEWVSYTGSNSAFWSYEWSKHGTCALSLFPTQTDYFNATITLNNQYEPNTALMNAGISPSSATSLTPSQLQSAFKQAWGVAPLITCPSSKTSSVVEIWLCVNTNLQAISCPSTIKPTPCPSNVGLPPGASVPSSCSSYYPANSANKGLASAPPPRAGSGAQATTPHVFWSAMLSGVLTILILS